MASSAASAISSPGKTSANQQAGIQFKRLPLRFEMNQGQTDPQVRFLARSNTGTAFLTSQGTVLRVYGPSQLAKRAVRTGLNNLPARESAVGLLRTVGSNPEARETDLGELLGPERVRVEQARKHLQPGVSTGLARVEQEMGHPVTGQEEDDEEETEDAAD